MVEKRLSRPPSVKAAMYFFALLNILQFWDSRFYHPIDKEKKGKHLICFVHWFLCIYILRDQISIWPNLIFQKKGKLTYTKIKNSQICAPNHWRVLLCDITETGVVANIKDPHVCYQNSKEDYNTTLKIHNPWTYYPNLLKLSLFSVSIFCIHWMYIDVSISVLFE